MYGRVGVVVWSCGCGVGWGLPLGGMHILAQPVHPLLWKEMKEIWNEEERELRDHDLHG